MWSVDKDTLTMVEGDYGIALPVTVKGITLDGTDTLRFVFSSKNGVPVLTKDYTTNPAELSFTRAESALFPVGGYAYRLDWFRDGAFMCNVIPKAQLKVVDKV